MKLSYLSGYHLEVILGDGDHVHKGYLLDPQKITAIPVIHNCFFFNEADLFIESLLHPKIEALYTTITESEPAYRQFIRTKGRKPSYDIYACFQPFNEAVKSIYPFIAQLKKKLKKGDVIVDLWNRSGWSASLLAGLFPEQQIVTLWEGNKDVLGYKGFRHWFADAGNNIQVIFHDLNKPLPFSDESISFVYGLDALHRFDQALMLKELIRVTKKEGAIICPHVHLSNSEPEPFFERGCRQLHGLHYDRLFNAMRETNPSLHGFVFSEPALFWFNEMKEGGQLPLISEPDTKDYNAMIALLPESWLPCNLEPFNYKQLENIDEAYILVNPLFSIDFSTQAVTLDHNHVAAVVGKLLSRHPVYEKRVEKAMELSLSEDACKLLYLSARIFSVKQIKERLQISQADFDALLHGLSSNDIIQVVPVKQNLVRLQHFLSVQEYVLPTDEQTLPALWKRTIGLFGDKIFINTEEDESEFTCHDIDSLITKTIITLQEKGIQKGNRVGLMAPFHLEQLVLFWAAAHIGAVIVPLNYDLPADVVNRIFQDITPSLVLTDEERLEKIPISMHANCMLIDSEENAANHIPSFSEWLSENENDISNADILADDLAVILYTSGSTGLPKGVMLTHGHLIRSARQMTETFAWEAKDKFYAIGDMDSMSGLRNNCIAPAEAGASIIIPAKANKTTPRSIAESINNTGATIIAASPALLGSLLNHKAETKKYLSKLRLILSTGSQLNSALKKSFFENFRLKIYNYYGLTETTGICISEKPSLEPCREESIGWPVSCIAQVVDENNLPMPKGYSGELRIYSENIMAGYWSNPSLTNEVIRNGWFYTGDIAEVLADGSIRLMGRKKDFIKSAYSEIIYTSEIENCLHGLSEVKEASACRFVTDDAEKMAVFVVPAKEISPESLVAAVKNHIASTAGKRKVPSVVRVVKQLPYGSNQKVLKNKLIELL